MAYCTKCGNPLKQNASFCTLCGNKISPQTDNYTNYIQTPEEKKLPAHNRIYIIAIIALSICLAGSIFWFSLKTESPKEVEIINKPEVTSGDAQLKPEENKSIDGSYVDSEGRLVFHSDCFIIVTGAFAYENDVRADIKRMKSQGYNNVGYLWIPDFASLSEKRFFAPFIGPFKSYAECLYNLKNTAPPGRFWYGVKVSHNPERVEIRL
jgi:hypothetical protein